MLSTDLHGEYLGIRSWCQFVKLCVTDSNQNVSIKKPENAITTAFHQNCIVGFVKLIQDYEDAFIYIILLGQKTWIEDDDIKKEHVICHLVQNAQKIGFDDAGFEAFISDKSFRETRSFLRSHTIRHDQQN